MGCAKSIVLALALLSLSVSRITAVQDNVDLGDSSCTISDKGGESCGQLEAFRYQSSLDWTKVSLKSILEWLISQSARSIITFCKSDQVDENAKIFNLVSEPFDCSKEGSSARFIGSVDADRLPKGPGKFEALDPAQVKPGIGKSCFDLSPGLSTLQAR